MDINKLNRALSGGMFANRIVFLPETDSTNDRAAALAVQGAEEGTVVFAESQRGGKGRLGRKWHSPPGVNLYFSMVLRPAIAPARAAGLTIVAGVAAAEALPLFCPSPIELKWPNDILAGGKKVCGILTEMRHSGGDIGHVVIGIGVNVNIRSVQLDEEIRSRATSLREESGRKISREDLAAAILIRFEEWYRVFLAEGFEPVRKEWIRKSGMTGRRVRVVMRNGVREGTVTGMDENGVLLLAAEGSGPIEIISGDVEPVSGEE
ncbi:MAG: biotin--[acetyl-CoA-carboxylase] ligase [Syntrophales bacterium]|nr:biotin--[acetyl-CoA-carboxylase] ligase [Syntrophales bacterium]